MTHRLKGGPPPHVWTTTTTAGSSPAWRLTAQWCISHANPARRNQLQGLASHRAKFQPKDVHVEDSASCSVSKFVSFHKLALHALQSVWVFFLVVMGWITSLRVFSKANQIVSILIAKREKHVLAHSSATSIHPFSMPSLGSQVSWRLSQMTLGEWQYTLDLAPANHRPHVD